jgi:arsenate reductase
VAEATGTALLLAAVVGSGIAGERLAGGNVALALLANTVATGAALVALILAFGPVSGAHFNPAVTLCDAARRGLARRAVPAYLAAQFAGALAGEANRLTGGRRGQGARSKPDREDVMTPKRKRVLILCTGNSARSQMAEGLLRHDGGAGFEVHSAGVRPTSVRPEAVEAMRETGIDISGHRSKSVEEFESQPFDYVITVCDNAKEQCPIYPTTMRRVHWSFDDPAEAAGDFAARLAVFRRVRDEIRARLREFISDEAGSA